MQHATNGPLLRVQIQIQLDKSTVTGQTQRNKVFPPAIHGRHPGVPYIPSPSMVILVNG